MVAASIALLGFGAYTSARISYAEFLFHQNTLDSVERAAKLDPANGRYRAWLAELLENQGRDATAALDAAVRLNPLDSRVWMRRGLDAESQGNRGEAERLLLQAAAIDRLMEPRWTLMNFYFRGGEEAKFWQWAKETLATGYGDRTPVFDLCWKMREDPTAIEAAAGARYPILSQFVRFLMAKGRMNDAAALAARMAIQAAPEDARTFTTCVDGLIAQGGAADAVHIWNALSNRGLVASRALNVEHGDSLTNGDFAHDPSGAGFDWRLRALEGVTALKTSDPAAMRFTFNGQQPEACELMTQKIPLRPAAKYRLRFSYRTTGIAPGSGLRVRAMDAATPDLASDTWTEAALVFAAGGQALGDLVVEYRRPRGFVRIEGTLELRSMSLGFAE